MDKMEASVKPGKHLKLYLQANYSCFSNISMGMYAIDSQFKP